MVPLDRVLLLTMPHAKKNCSQDGASSSAAPGFETPVRVKKTRMSREASNLGITANQRRFMAPTLTPQTPETPQEEMRIAISNHQKAVHANEVRWEWNAPAHAYMAQEVEVQELSHSVRMDRRAAVRYIFCGVYGMPPREEWQLEGGKTLVSEIATRLSISIGNRGLIVDVMLECLKHGAECELAARLSLRGRTNLIEELSTQAEVIYGAVESGQGIQQATVLLALSRISRRLCACWRRSLRMKARACWMNFTGQGAGRCPCSANASSPAVPAPTAASPL